AQPGVIESVDGVPMGRHNGLMYHTIGQRQGLGIGGVAGAGDAPWYVVDKDMQRNVLLVAQGSEHPRLFKRALNVSTIHWLDGCGPALPARLTAKTRYRQPDQDCRLIAASHGYQVLFDQP